MKSNKYLTIGLLTGFIVGGCIGVLAWAFLQNLFAISICAGIGMLIGIVIGTLIDVTGKPPVPLQTKNKRKRGTSCENSSFFVFRISTRPASLLARLFHLGNPLFAFFRKLLRPWKQVLQKIQIRIVHVFRNLGQ